MNTKLTTTILISFFIDIKYAYPQKSDIDQVHGYKGYVLIIKDVERLYFIATNHKSLNMDNFRFFFQKENYRQGFVFKWSSNFDHLSKYISTLEVDSLKHFGYNNKDYIKILPVEITYEGRPIINLRKPLKDLAEPNRKEYLRANRIGEEYLYLKSGVDIHFFYDTRIREIIDIKVLSSKSKK